MNLTFLDLFLRTLQKGFPAILSHAGEPKDGAESGITKVQEMVHSGGGPP